MALSDPKRMFVTNMRVVAAEIARAINKAQDVHAVFFDRAYDQESEVTDTDLAEWDLTRTSVLAFINACEQLVNLRDDLPVTQGDWGAAINVARDN